MTDLEDLLFEIFEALRQRRVPLGMPDYLLALKMIYELAHPSDELSNPAQLEAIKDLCRLFWAKSYEDLQLFDEMFEIETSLYLQTKDEEQLQNVPPSGTRLTFISPSNTSDLQIPPLKRQQKQPMIIPKAHSQPTMTRYSKISSYQQTVRHHLTPRLPIDKRDMAGIWRQLRRPQREGPLAELDVQATTDALSRIGFLQPVLQPRRRNQAKMVLLLDQGGSMEPFSLFTAALLDSIVRSGSLKQTHILYFHDCPENYVYTSPTFLGARNLEDIFVEHCHGSSILIVSDAGAARGHYDRARTSATKEFLDQLCQYTHLSAWLNPVPKIRWTGTTAWNIAQLLPMFQLDWEGLNDVVNVLRGQVLTGVSKP